MSWDRGCASLCLSNSLHLVSWQLNFFLPCHASMSNFCGRFTQSLLIHLWSDDWDPVYKMADDNLSFLCLFFLSTSRKKKFVRSNFLGTVTPTLWSKRKTPLRDVSYFSILESWSYKLWIRVISFVNEQQKLSIGKFRTSELNDSVWWVRRR